MDLMQCWAVVDFTAQNGDPEGLLTTAAAAGLHLTQVLPRPGGFSARCTAWQYKPLSRLARKRRVRLRVQKRSGLFFVLRPWFRRRGLWAGMVLFVPLLLWLQGAIWAIDGNSLTPGQQARAGSLLWAQGLIPGAFVSEETLRNGEYALLQSGEFSWVSLNFTDGRLTVEAAAAKPVPEIASGTLHGIRAKTAGTVLDTNLTSGTMLVIPGQTVEAGQGLIGTARTERDGTLIFQPAAGRVLAQFEWENTQEETLLVTLDRLTGKTQLHYTGFFAGQTATFSALPWHTGGDTKSIEKTRHLQPSLFGLKLPFFVEETTHYFPQREIVSRTEEEALTLARFHSREALFAAYPDAEILARKEDFSVEGECFHYRVCYTVAADICEENR